MATKEKWAKVFHSRHQYKDDIPIYFGNDEDAQILWDSSNATLDITGATQFTGTMAIAGDVTLVGNVTTTGETSAMTVEDPTTATNAYYGYIDAGGATGWTGSMAAVRGRVNITNTGTSIGNAYGGWFGVQFDSTFTATGAGLTCGVYAEIDNELAGRAPNAVAYFQECVTGSGVNTNMPILVLTSDGGGSNEDKSTIAIEFGHQPAATTVSTGSSGMFDTTTIRVKVNTLTRFIPLSTATDAFTTAAVITTENTTASTATTEGALICGGGLGVAGRGNFGGIVIVTSTNATTAGVNAIFGYNVAGALWSTGNQVGVRGKVAISGTNAFVSATGVWAGLDFTTVSGAGTGITCALNAEVSSNNAKSPNAIVYIQSLPGAAANFSGVPYIVFTESGGGTGSNILFELGHQFAQQTTTVTDGTLFWEDTIQIAVNKVAGTRIPYYIPLSTVQGEFTFAYPATITVTAPTVAENALAGIASVTSAWASGEVNAVYGKTTITLDSDGSTYSAAGGHFELEMVGNATSGLGLLASCMVKFTSNLEEPNAILYLESYPTGSCDLSETPFITFCDYKAGSGVKSNTLFRIGDPMMGQAISTGDGKLSYNQTLRCALYDTPIYLVTSTAQGTYTTAYPVVLSYTSGAALAITQATVGNDARIATFHGTCATPAMGDGVGNVEVDTTLTGQATGHLSPFSSWINVTTGTVTAVVTSYVTPMTVGIYEGGSGTVTSGLLAFGMRMQAILTNSPGILAPFSVNTTKTITAIFHVNSQPNFGYVAGLHTSAVTGSVPLMCALGGGSVKYVRVYDTAA